MRRAKRIGRVAAVVPTFACVRVLMLPEGRKHCEWTHMREIPKVGARIVYTPSVRDWRWLWNDEQYERLDERNER